MKSKDFAVSLVRFSDLLRSVSATAAEANTRQLLALFEISPATSVADVTKKLHPATASLIAGNPSLQQAAAPLAELHAFLQGQAKPALLTDLAAVVEFLKANGSLSLSALLEAAPQVLVKPRKPIKVVPPVRHDLIDMYCRKLEEALGDEPGFVSLFKMLSEDEDVGKQEAAAIAKRFTGASGASKAAALKKVWARHHNLMTFRAKSESRAGRSAA